MNMNEAAAEISGSDRPVGWSFGIETNAEQVRSGHVS
jgi:hypothetical protein